MKTVKTITCLFIEKMSVFAYFRPSKNSGKVTPKEGCCSRFRGSSTCRCTHSQDPTLYNYFVPSLGIGGSLQGSSSRNERSPCKRESIRCDSKPWKQQKRLALRRVHLHLVAHQSQETGQSCSGRRDVICPRRGLAVDVPVNGSASPCSREGTLETRQ